MTKKEDERDRRESLAMSEAAATVVEAPVPTLTQEGATLEQRVLLLEEVVGNLVRETADLRKLIVAEEKTEDNAARARLFGTRAPQVGAGGLVVTETPRRRVAAK